MRAVDGQKQCHRCAQVKPVSEYHRDRTMKDGYKGDCKQCRLGCETAWRDANRERYRASQKAWVRRNKGRYKDSIRRHLYGISPAEFAGLMAAQGGVCAICGGKDGDRALNIDHCHDTGAIRGLLCRHCNLAIGHLKESPTLVARALAYLQPSIQPLPGTRELVEQAGSFGASALCRPDKTGFPASPS